MRKTAAIPCFYLEYNKFLVSKPQKILHTIGKAKKRPSLRVQPDQLEAAHTEPSNLITDMHIIRALRAVYANSFNNPQFKNSTENTNLT